VLAASNQDLEPLVESGRFRQDLYYRLGVFTIRLPVLRERGDDLNLLIQHYLRRFNRELGKDAHQVSPETMSLLRHYPWPGNVRELQSVLKQALLLATGPILLPDFMPAALRKSEPQHSSGTSSLSMVKGEDADGSAGLEQLIESRLRDGTDNLYEETLKRMERLLLTRVLQHTGGNQLQAAKILGITRGSLRTKLRDLGITIARTVTGGEDPDD
jgi:two-component system nitrogen regulation response regulator GlnG